MDANRLKILELANLEIDSKIGKDRHFIAADRKSRIKTLLGLISVIGAAIIASKAFKDIFSAIEVISQYKTLAISMISLLVGVSTAVLGFFGLEKQVAQHRVVGNMYIAVARKARRLLNKMVEGLDGDGFEKEFSKLLEEYLNINREGEGCPTSKADSEGSIRLNGSLRAKIKGQIRGSDDAAFGITPDPVRTSLARFVSDSVKVKFAFVLNKMGILSDKYYSIYIAQYD